MATAKQRPSRHPNARALMTDASTANPRRNQAKSRENTGPPPGVALHAWIKAQSKKPETRHAPRSTLLDASMFQRLMVANLQLEAQPRRQTVTCSSCGTIQTSVIGMNGGCRTCGSGLSMSTSAVAFAESAGLLRKEDIPAPLTELEWGAVESSCAARGDGTCPICMEPFARGHQVMLSCSHIFHKTCLQSFENFVKMEARTCPLCRHRNYQKKMTIKGTEAHLLRCAIVIQAHWRGHQVRKAYRLMLKQHYHSGRGNPIARRRFFQRELAICTTSLEAATTKRTAAVDELMADMDRTIRENQEVASTNAANQQRLRAEYTKPHNSNSVNWDTVALHALQRCDDEVCAICMGNFRDGKAMSLLSCSHVFHTTCISSFEQFNLQAVDTCPICRSCYQAKSLDPNFFVQAAT